MGLIQRSKITSESALVATRWRSRDKNNSAPALIKEMFCTPQSPVKIIGCNKVIFKRAAEPTKVTLY
jgi:hypothetical protein